MDQKALEQAMSKILDKKLNPVVKNLEKLQSKIDKIDKLEESISFFSKQYDDFIMKIKGLEDMNASLVDENRCLKAELQNTSNNLKLMKQELNNSQQYSRRDCLEIKGIPIQRNENTNEVVKSVGNLIGVEIKDEDISISHRLAAKNSQTGLTRNDPAIIVKFVRRGVRDQFYTARKHLRGKSTKDIGLSRTSEHNIYIGESLTQQNRQLFNSCLEKKRQLKYKFIWSSAGRIFLRKDENSPSISIFEMKDLDKIR